MLGDVRLIPTALYLLVAFFAASLHAAPLDTLLSADRPHRLNHGELEIGYDAMNETLDLFGLRDRFERYAGTTVGDYEGGHVRGGLAVAERLWLEGSYWNRALDAGHERADFRSWHLAAQWQLFAGDGAGRGGFWPALAVRYTHWGNEAEGFETPSRTDIAGLTVDALRVTEASDRQRQLNLIASWAPVSATRLSAFVGYGKSRIRFGQILAAVEGCEYQLSSPSPTAFHAVATHPQSAECPVRGIYRNDPDGPYPGPGMGIAYDSDYWQVGGNLEWQGARWRIHGGYLLYRMDRPIDSNLESAGKPTYHTNHLVTAELGRKVTAQSEAFLRANYFRHQFVGEIPLAYNTYTARHFDKHYGFVTFGIRFGF